MNCVLTINGGSSSIKFALFEQAGLAKRSLNGQVERIGLADTVINAEGANAVDHLDEVTGAVGAAVQVAHLGG